MVSDILLNKAATIERSVKRAREEYKLAGKNFAHNYTHQDAAILNIQRACEAAIDMGQHLIKEKRLGIPQSARDIFKLLAENGNINHELAKKMQTMVGFRNIAVPDDQVTSSSSLTSIVESIILSNLQDFLDFSQTLLQQKKNNE